MIIRRLVMTVPLVGFGWVATLASVAVLTDEAPGYVAMFPSARMMEKLDGSIAILAANRFSVTLSAKGPSAAAQLYRAGARLVLPAGLPGCLPLPSR